jgi:hypothetical protein
MAGKIVADTLEHSTAGSVTTDFVVSGSAKAWVNYKGTATNAINDSFNISSVTDNGTGDYTNNFSSSLGSADYCFQGSGNASGSGSTARGPVITQHTTISSSALRFYANRNGDNGAGPTNLDYSILTTSIHGDLA